MSVGDDELDAAQSASREVTQELEPERLRLARANPHADDFPYAVSVYSHGDYHRDRYDTAGLTHFHIRCVDPQIRPVAFERTREKRVHALVDVSAQPRHLALGDPGHPHRLDQLIDGSRRDTLNVRFLDHRRQRLLGGPTRFEECRKVCTATQLWDPQVDRADARLPQPIAIPVATVAALGGSLAILGAGALLDLELHEPFGDVAEQFPDDLVLGPLLNELGECHTDLGHRGVPSRKVVCAKTTFAKSHDGRPLSYEAAGVIHHALGHDH